MRAIFKIHPELLKRLIIEENEEMASDTNEEDRLICENFFTVEDGRTIHVDPSAGEAVTEPCACYNGEGVFEVYGEAQAIMFLIGRLAAHGEDGLLSVETFPAVEPDDHSSAGPA